MFKKEKVIISVLLIVGVIFSLNSAWALSLDEADTAAPSTVEAANSGGSFKNVYVETDIIGINKRNNSNLTPSEEEFDGFDDILLMSDFVGSLIRFNAWKRVNAEETIIPPETIFQTAPSLVETIRIGRQDEQNTAVFQDNINAQIKAAVPVELPKDITLGKEVFVRSIVSYIVDDLSPFSAKMDDAALYSAVVSIFGLDMPVSLEISYDNKTLENGMALITARKEKLKITGVNFLLNEEVDSYSIVVTGEGESDVILDIADLADDIKAKAIIPTKFGGYQLEGKDNKFILTEPDCFDSGNGDLENEPVSIIGGRELEFSSLRYVEEYRSLVDSMENYGECPKISAPAFRLIGTVPEAELEVRLTGGEYEQELREIGAVINYVDQDEFVYRITVSPNKILDLIGLDFVSYVDVHSGE